jgi:hypothetical protein
MRRIFKYGFFTGMDPVCPARLAEYPELRYVAMLTPEELRTAYREDLIDAQHQWVTTYRIGSGHFVSAPMQECGEDGCDAVRPTPLDLYPEHLQMQVMRLFMIRNLPTT